MKRFAIVLVAMTLAGCSWFRSGSDTGSAPQLPSDAVAYRCDQGKRLVVRYPAGAKYVIVIFPDREFRLDPVGTGRYSNGRGVLDVSGDTASLYDGATALFTGCAKPAN
jgi:membrane-bound inhibitor of C-type lysozyme